MGGWNSIYSTMIWGMQNQTANLARLQEQLSSGSRVLRASDAPSDAYGIMSLQSQSLSLDSYTKNIDSVSSQLQSSSSIVQQISDCVSRAKVLLTQAASQTYTQDQRQSIAEEINSVLEQVVSLANTRQTGKYLFAGDDVTHQPYQVVRSNGSISAVTYQGGSANLGVPVALGVQYSGAVVGNEIFRNNRRSAVQFLGNTGAQAGSGTSSVRGDVWLQVTHGTTVYDDAGASGVAPGEGSSAGDTIVGDSHKLIIDVDAKTVALDDAGNAVSYTDASTNLRLPNAAGDVVYVDMSHLKLLTGTVTVNIKASAKLSIDDGLTSVDLDATSANQAVRDSRTGGVLYVDGASIARAGLEPIRVTGTYDLFSTLINARDVLMNTRGQSQSQQAAMISQAINSVDEVMAGVSQGTTILGARQQALDTLKTSLQSLKDNSDAQASQLGEADVAQLAGELARTQTLYEMTLASAAKLLNVSLLNYI